MHIVILMYCLAKKFNFSNNLTYAKALRFLL